MEFWLWVIVVYLLCGTAFAGYMLYDWSKSNSWRRVASYQVFLGLLACVLGWLPVVVFEIGCDVAAMMRGRNGFN